MARKLPPGEQLLFSKPSQSAGMVWGAAGFSVTQLREMMIANFSALDPSPAPQDNNLFEEEEIKDDWF
jgi:hypothetical protein